MSEAWVTIITLAVLSAAARAVGPLAIGGRELGREVNAVIELLAPALLAALIVVETVGGTDGLDPDARIAGVAAAGLVLSRRRSAMLAAITLAALTTALLRALT